MRMIATLWMALGLWLSACDSTPAPAAEPPPSPAAPKAAEIAAAEAPATEAPALEEPADPDEACAQIIAVAYAGAKDAPDGVTRDAATARTRAEALHAQVVEGADFRELAADQSDAAAKVRRGAIGTFTRDRWPEKHGALEEAVFAAKVNGITPVVEAPYGFTFARRCKVEKVHTRHILVRYAGAKRAPEDVKRTREEAQALAMEIYGKAKGDGADFEALAREYSEDSSAERGGDMGEVGRGLFVPPYEEAAFALKPGSISAPVETVFGFHVIQRL